MYGDPMLIIAESCRGSTMLLHVRSSLLGGLWSEKLGSALAVIIFGLRLAGALITPELLRLGQIRYGLLFFVYR